MFLTTKYSGYNRSGEQTAAGQFLVLLQDISKPVGPNNMRAVVRFARLRQCGQYMMGSVSVGSERVTLSGSYGGDGLPVAVSTETFNRGTPVPAELYEAWNAGGGWNGAGTEAQAFRRWATSALTNSPLRKEPNL